VGDLQTTNRQKARRLNNKGRLSGGQALCPPVALGSRPDFGTPSSRGATLPAYISLGRAAHPTEIVSLLPCRSRQTVFLRRCLPIDHAVLCRWTLGRRWIRLICGRFAVPPGPTHLNTRWRIPPQKMVLSNRLPLRASAIRSSWKCGVTLSVICLLSPLGVRAQEQLEHPYIEPRDVKPETCLTCHPEKKQGSFIHTAVRMGCPRCHHIVTGKNQTTITLFARGGDLCANCHQAQVEPVLHGPYKNGQCLVCHEPHASEFKAQIRAEVNSLCLECHAPKPNPGNTVNLFGLQSISKAEFEAAPKIELDPSLRFGHPRPAHSVADVADPLHAGEKISCLSCHAPHASELPHLLVSAKGGENVCDACHRVIDKHKEGKPDGQAQQP
jgi:predicted CXXCH cytochrome family protein